MARVARRRNRPRVARWWSHIGFPREMTHTPLQTHFPPARYARARYARRRPTYALCELSDNHCSSERARLRARCRVQSGRQWPSLQAVPERHANRTRARIAARAGATTDDCATAVGWPGERPPIAPLAVPLARPYRAVRPCRSAGTLSVRVTPNRCSLAPRAPMHACMPGCARGADAERAARRTNGGCRRIARPFGNRNGRGRRPVPIRLGIGTHW